MRRSSSIKSRARLVLAGLAACVAFGASASSAQAGVLVSSADDCDSQELFQPFLPWADPAHYTPLRNHGFENGASGWSLSGGAEVGSGNESHYVNDADDSRSLRLPAGATAVSSPICVGLEHPTLRGFARNTGSALSTLNVEVLFEDAAGNVQSLPIGANLGGPSWQPTAQMVVVANLLPLLPGERTAVAFRFKATGAGGNWRIDDFYVDPYRRS